MTQLSLFSGRVSELDKLDEFVGVMGQIQSFLVGDGPDAPLLHGQGAKEDFDWFALLIGTDVIEDIGVGGDGLTFDFGLEDGNHVGFSDAASKGRTQRVVGRKPAKQGGDFRRDVGIARSGVEQGPATTSVDLDLAFDASHRPDLEFGNCQIDYMTITQRKS